MQKGLLRLNDDELNWLDCKIGVIDVQYGCPVQCITCGVSAPKYSGSVPWSNYMTLSDSILEVKAKKGIDVLESTFILPFYSSDPVYYTSQDGTIKKNISDIALDLTSRHNKNVHITTSGWKPGNNHMQRAMDKIVELYGSKDSKLTVRYSIKTVSKQIMNEYDSFLRKHHQVYLSDINFIENSCFVSNLIDNFKTLNSMHYTSFDYIFQHIKKSDIPLLNSEYSKYSSLFSKKFMIQLHDSLEKTKLFPFFESDYFLGIGSALNIGNIEKDQYLKLNHKLANSNNELFENSYVAQIENTGVLNIYYSVTGRNNVLSKVLVPKEHFTNVAKSSKSNSDKRKYEMLANLQGKELLR